MADEVDIANEVVDLEVANALKKMTHRFIPGKLGAQNCAHCEETIPQERRALGFSLCVECATVQERNRSLYVG